MPNGLPSSGYRLLPAVGLNLTDAGIQLTTPGSTNHLRQKSNLGLSLKISSKVQPDTVAVEALRP